MIPGYTPDEMPSLFRALEIVSEPGGAGQLAFHAFILNAVIFMGVCVVRLYTLARSQDTIRGKKAQGLQEMPSRNVAPVNWFHLDVRRRVRRQYERLRQARPSRTGSTASSCSAGRLGLRQFLKQLIQEDVGLDAVRAAGHNDRIQVGAGFGTELAVDEKPWSPFMKIHNCDASVNPWGPRAF